MIVSVIVVLVVRVNSEESIVSIKMILPYMFPP